MRRPLSADVRERLFVGSAPLATCSAKICIAYALGLIGRKTKHDLETINEVRNAFAHAAQSITFRNKQIRARMSGLHAMPVVKMVIDAAEKMEEKLDDLNFSNSRGRFLMAVGGYIRVLSELSRSNTGPGPVEEFDF
jgi:DNA-binding MltR family transcriptional regulator